MKPPDPEWLKIGVVLIITSIFISIFLIGIYNNIHNTCNRECNFIFYIAKYLNFGLFMMGSTFAILQISRMIYRWKKYKDYNHQ